MKQNMKNTTFPALVKLKNQLISVMCLFNTPNVIKVTGEFIKTVTQFLDGYNIFPNANDSTWCCPGFSGYAR